MKICVSGAGSASAVSLLSLFKFPFLYNKFEINCIYDPNIPTLEVGESTSRHVLKLLAFVIGFNENNFNDIDCTFKRFTRYNWTKANGKDFDVSSTPGLHINSKKFSFFVLNKLKNKFKNFKVINDNIQSLSSNNSKVTVQCNCGNYDYDFVIDCRNIVDEFDENYCVPVFESVNSVILYTDYKNYNEDFTSAYVHENGWMFGIPLQNRKTFGYLYNNKITSDSDAINHFSELKDVDASNIRKLSWKQLYRKKIIQDRVMCIGGNLFFFDPHHSLPLHYYVGVLLNHIPTIVNDLNNIPYDNINSLHYQHMQEIQDLIALNYVGKNNMKSDFWNYAMIGSYNRLSSSKYFTDWAKKSIASNKIGEFSFHDESLMTSYINGYNIDYKKFTPIV